MELREGAVIADKFRLVRLLGKGGMGEVWVAQHTSLDIPCAVKFIHAESAQKPEVRARFEREAKAAAQLRTNTVVQILDYGIFENTPYIAMEYLEGEPLNARLKRHGRLDPHETFRVIRDVGRALTKAHAAGIVHRDLKPENIFLVVDDDREIAKVLDFGVAKSADQLDSNTQTGALLGTPYFMSPEQAQGTKTVDHRADLWSLAVVAFRCITGELPFNSTALGDLLIKIVTHPLAVPSQIAPGVPEGFDAWWQRAAQRDPNHRYQSAKELVQALGMALNVSMPSTLGNTPMPGGQIGAEIRGAQQQMRTMIADPSELPAPGAQLPFGAPQPYGTGPYPQGARGGYGNNPQYDTGSYPQQHGSHANAPMHGHPALGDSLSSASVAGVPIAARPAGSGGGKVALIMVVVAILALGGVGGFLFFTNDKPTPAATGETVVDEKTDDKPKPAPVVEPSADEPADDDTPAPEPSSSTDAVVDPPSPTPHSVPVPRPVPVPVPNPVPVPVPQPGPSPAPAPVPYDPAGF